MFGLSLGDLALKRVWNHRTHRSRMSLTSLGSGVSRAAVSFLFRVDRLKVLVEAGLVAFSSACFECADEVPKEARFCSLAHLPKVFSSYLRGLSKVAVMGFCA